MKTLIIVSIPGAALALGPEDFPTGGPVEGRSYEFDGQIYKAVEIIETLGARGLQGDKIGSDSRLLSFVDAVCNGDLALKQRLLKPVKIGASEAKDELSPGGIIFAGKEQSGLEVGEQFDHIVIVRAVPAEKLRALSQVLLRDPLNFSAASNDEAPVDNGNRVPDAACADGHPNGAPGLPKH